MELGQDMGEVSVAGMPLICGGYILHQDKVEDVDKMTPLDQKQIQMMNEAKAHWECVFEYRA